MRSECGYHQLGTAEESKNSEFEPGHPDCLKVHLSRQENKVDFTYQFISLV